MDRVQRRFLRELGFTELSAFKNFRLAPLNARRDMAMLGALHKVNLGTAPPQLRSLFPLRLGPPSMRGGWTLVLRRIRPPHSKQLFTAATFESTNVLQRSLFGLVHLYNKLPQHAVDSPSVSSFQKKLQSGLLKFAENNAENMPRFYSTTWKHMPPARLDRLCM